MRILETLTHRSVILLSFVAMVIIGASFAYFQKFIGGDLLDMATSSRDSLDRLAEMNSAQKKAHMWITLIPDGLYPIAYGAFFGGATYKLAGPSRKWVVVPAVITVTADYLENIAQVLMLNGVQNAAVVKSIFSPIKFSAFIVMALLLLLCAITVLMKHIKNKSNATRD